MDTNGPGMGVTKRAAFATPIFTAEKAWVRLLPKQGETSRLLVADPGANASFETIAPI
ncbi:MAG: hypothetical protein JO108_19895 [Acidobacteriaceae bacterium]|nr:hypothetical protein [Acidobacteriaceae bacterium]